MCRQPEELLLVTFNHLDVMRRYVGGSSEHVDMINSVQKRTKEVSVMEGRRESASCWEREREPHVGRERGSLMLGEREGASCWEREREPHVGRERETERTETVNVLLVPL